MRILLVEDDLTLSDAIVRGVRSLGIETVHAATVAEAREQLLFAAHDVIVLDVMLPGGTGRRKCDRTIKAVAAWSDKRS